MKRLTFLIVLALAALLVVACGGGGGGEDAGGAAPAALTFAGFDDFRFDPTNASVPAGAQVTLTLQNEGPALEHSWVLVSDQADATTVTDADAIGGASTGSVAAGESNSITFTAPPAGTYQYVCTIPGHAAGGMVGTLTVAP